VFLGGEIPFGSQHGFVSRQLTQSVEIVMRNPAVRAVYVVIRSDGIDERSHRSNSVGIVVAGQTIAENERAGVRLAQRAIDEFVVTMRYGSSPLANHSYSISAGAQICARVRVL